MKDSAQRASPYVGRRVLMATPPMTMDRKAVTDIMEQVLPDFRLNVSEIDTLYKFYKGDQAILRRVKSVRPEIMNTIVENRAMEVVSFKTGYEFSHPIQYTNASEADSKRIDKLNIYARLDGKQSKDIELAEWMYIAGQAYRICLVNRNAEREDEAPYYTQSLDPRNAFVVISNEMDRKPLLCGTRTVYKNVYGVEVVDYGIWTDTQYFLLKDVSNDGTLANAKITEEVNPLGRLPIIEYRLNSSRIGYVEMCWHLFNAINNIDSNRIDAIEQFVQALLVFVNCELGTDENGQTIAPSTGDTIAIKGQAGMQADVKYVIAQLDQAQTQITKEDMLDAIYEICGVPDRKTRGNGGGDTGQAVVLRDGWGAAEARAKTTENLFKQSENDYLRVVLKICRDIQWAAQEIGDLTLRDIGITFMRTRNDNMLTKAQTLETLLKCSINPEDAIEYCGMFNDPTAVWLKSKGYQQELATATREVEKNSTADSDAALINDDADATSEVEKLSRAGGNT